MSSFPVAKEMSARALESSAAPWHEEFALCKRKILAAAESGHFETTCRLTHPQFRQWQKIQENGFAVRRFRFDEAVGKRSDNGEAVGEWDFIVSW